MFCLFFGVRVELEAILGKEKLLVRFGVGVEIEAVLREETLVGLEDGLLWLWGGGVAVGVEGCPLFLQIAGQLAKGLVV